MSLDVSAQVYSAFSIEISIAHKILNFSLLLCTNPSFGIIMLQERGVPVFLT